MLLLASQLENLKIISLRSSRAVAQTAGVVIDPRELKIVAFVISGAKNYRYLLSEDVREIRPSTLLIDEENEIVESEDLVRLQETLKLNFSIRNKRVVTETNRPLGKAEDSVVESTTFYIQKIHVKQSILKSLSSSKLIIDRKQIVEVTDKKIVVREAAAKNKKTSFAYNPARAVSTTGIGATSQSTKQ